MASGRRDHTWDFGNVLHTAGRNTCATRRLRTQVHSTMDNTPNLISCPDCSAGRMPETRFPRAALFGRRRTRGRRTYIRIPGPHSGRISALFLTGGRIVFETAVAGFLSNDASWFAWSSWGGEPGHSA